MKGTTYIQIPQKIKDLGLKPCPFCGRIITDATIEAEQGAFENFVDMSIKCFCGAEVNIWAADKENALVKAVDLWNSRAAEAERKEE